MYRTVDSLHTRSFLADPLQRCRRAKRCERLVVGARVQHQREGTRPLPSLPLLCRLSLYLAACRSQPFPNSQHCFRHAQPTYDRELCSISCRIPQVAEFVEEIRNNYEMFNQYCTVVRVC